MLDFLNSIEHAHKLPETPGRENPIPDVFKNPGFRQMVDTVPSNEAGKIAGIAEYDFVFQSARLQIGKEQVDFVNGQAIYEDHDDSERLKEIMDRSLSGRAIINKKTETFLKNGTVVIWIEWLEPKTSLGAKKKNVLTTAELLSPDQMVDKSEEDQESDQLPDFSSVE